RKDIMYALGRVGSARAIGTLSGAAAQANYRMEKTGANEAYIALLTRLATTGNKEVAKAAANLLKAATKAGATQTRIAALEILLSTQEQPAKMILTAMKDPDKEFRNAALDFASGYANEAMYIDLVKVMAKATPAVKVDILNWLGREATCPDKKPVLRNLELRFDLPARNLFLDQLKSDNFAVKQAAAWLLVRMGDPNNIPALASLLAGSDQQVILLGQDALAAFPVDIAPTVAKVIPAATDAGKVAALELLAMRKASANINSVFEQTRSSSPEVSLAAHLALKDVAAEREFTQLCGMLETSTPATAPMIQQGVITALSTMPADQQVQLINRRMIQAGDSKKHLYYIVLAATGQPEALTQITKELHTSSSVARDAAFEALLAWQGSEAAGELYAVCLDNSFSNYFDRAIDRYIELVSNPAITGENRLLSLRKAMEIAHSNVQRNTILRQVERTGAFMGMIYAGQFLDNPATAQAAANAVMNIALSHPEYTGTNVRALLEKVSSILDNPDAGYQREAIKKHLDEMPAGEGFVSIFNGKDLTGWKGLVADPIKRSKMTPAQLAKAQEKADEQMRKDWKVENGLLVFDGTGYDNLCTVKQYGDIEMYIDWMLDPAGPEADAGIYLRGTPQVQIWDTARVNVGAQVGSGGLYNNQTHPSDPIKVADNKMGEWNSFYIKMVGDRVTVYLNGELVVDDVILENYWDRSQPIPAIEQLELQAHGSKVYYRDIYVKELERPEPYQLTPEEKKEGYQILFDGTHMNEWTGNLVDYTLEDGCISMIPSKSYGGNLYTKKEYANFVIRFEFQLTPAANNGLGIRTPMEGDAAYVGMELQILDNEHPVYADLKEYQYHGSVYGVIPAKRGYLKPVGEWNYQEVIADGDHIKIILNGEVILDGNIREASQNGTATIDGLEHPGLLNKKGHIAFLGHGSPVKFRNIRIKELK
ncbi:MAG: DUF1080 domain-containing protein, partial [Tannerellaceae bacterium]|nr:DUF1080 domain-containing protein [Tannerellaceae bacterium]